MDNSQKIRIATSNLKPEKFQAGLRIGGSFNFREEFAEIVEGPRKKDPRKYMVYKFAPERGFEEMDSDVVEFPKGNGLAENEPGVVETTASGEEIKRTMVNRLVEKRNSIGWFKGKEFRAGTILQDYLRTPRNVELARKFFEITRNLDSLGSVDRSEMEKKVKEAMKVEREMDKGTIYSTFEDGLFKLLPQESTIYLGEEPSDIERYANFFFIGRDKHNRLRVENYWDLWPGSIPGLKGIHFGTGGEDAIYPFDKYNNGGYIIKDEKGEVAKIEIKDFFLFYGQDVLYRYYLDLDGNGKIDKKTELIGEVLCRTTHDGKLQITQSSEAEKPETDLTFTVNYSFMAPNNDITRGMEYFKLCAYIESMIPDQVHRGFGKHSLLGLINDQRSDIMLFNDLTLRNMSRALTQESTLAAKYDIVELLKAAKRAYAEELSEKYHLLEQSY